MARQAVSSLVGKDRKGEPDGKIFESVSNKNISDQKIIFGGTSAGGRGSMVLVDHLHDLLDDSTMIYGLHDSGAYQGHPPDYQCYYLPHRERIILRIQYMEWYRSHIRQYLRWSH